MFEFKSRLKLDVPSNCDLKSLKKWIACQRAISVGIDFPFHEILKGVDPVNKLATLMMVMNNSDGICVDENYLLIQPEFDIENQELSFFEDSDGVPSGYHLKLMEVTVSSGIAQRRVTLPKFYLIKDAIPEPIKTVTPKKKSKTTAKTSNKTATSSKKKATVKTTRLRRKE